MSAFALNRNYELQLPERFVGVNREEMEYVDGGIDSSTSWNWIGRVVTLSLDSSEANKLAIGGSGLLGVIGAWTCAVPVASAVLWTLSIVWGSYIGWLNSDGSGVNIKIQYFGSSSVVASNTIWDR